MGSKEPFYADIMALHPEVTGSCNLVVVKFPDGNTIRFVVDCGLFQEIDHDELNQSLPFNPENVDFCLVTHNHVDHIGRLPYMVKNGFYKEIYTTETTSKLMPIALADTCKILRDVAKRRNKKTLYSDEDVAKTMRLVKPCAYNKTIQVMDNVKVTFFNNGHLMGASMILVQISYPMEYYQELDTINLLFTGDYKGDNLFFDVEPLPDWVLELPLMVIQESTYGDMDTDEMEKCFKTNILKCLAKGGTVVAPVFSLGRSQEILYELRCMQDKGELDKNIPIYLDGKLAIKYTSLHYTDGLDVKEEMRDFLPTNYSVVNKTNRSDVLKDTDPKVILTTAGMGSYGPAQLYIPEYITRKDALIHFTGYTAEGTLGNRLKTAKMGGIVEIAGIMVKKQADVEYTKEYSAHAKADEMIAFLQQFKDLKLVLVNHGEEETKEIFAERILEEVSAKRVGILGRDYFFRVNPYGFVKSLSTKFE